MVKPFAKRKFFNAIAVFAAIVCIEGCASLTPVDLLLNQELKTVSMTANINKKYEVIKHFKVKQKVPFLFLVRLHAKSGSVDLNELLEPELHSTETDAIVNLSIKGDATFGDLAFPVGVGILGGLVFSPLFVFTVLPLFEDLKTYEVEGDLVKYIEQTSSPEKTKVPFDPLTGLPLQKQKIQYNAETGLPIKE